MVDFLFLIEILDQPIFGILIWCSLVFLNFTTSDGMNSRPFDHFPHFSYKVNACQGRFQVLVYPVAKFASEEKVWNLYRLACAFSKIAYSRKDKFIIFILSFWTVQNFTRSSYLFNHTANRGYIPNSKVNYANSLRCFSKNFDIQK